MPVRPKLYPLLPVSLTQVTTSDGVDLAGAVVEPKRREKTALVWLHGLTSSFDSGQALMVELSRACVRRGIGYFKFNTRGHHLVDFRRPAKRGFVGSSFEKFPDCLKDIRAVIALAKRRGYRRIILAGHSTGASKALYYAAKTKDRAVKGLLLAGPASDIAGELKHVPAWTLLKRVAQAKRWAKRNPNRMVPAAWGPWSAARYVSMLTPNGAEDVFPYHRLGRRWTTLASVRIPTLVIFGEKDVHIDRPADTLIELYRSKAKKTRRFTDAVVAGASHGFHRHQPQLVRLIGRWLDRL